MLYSAALCSVVLYCALQSWRWSAEEDERVALLHCMLHRATHDELQSVGQDEDLPLLPEPRTPTALVTTTTAGTDPNAGTDAGTDAGAVRRARVLALAHAPLGGTAKGGTPTPWRRQGQWRLCGLRWNYSIKGSEQTRFTAQRIWSKEEVSCVMWCGVTAVIESS